MQYPLKTLIVEDNETDLQLLKIHLEKYPGKFDLCPPAKTFEEAATMLATTKFGISFIDYNLDKSWLWYDLIEAVEIKNMGIIVSHTAEKKSDLERSEGAKNYILLKKALNSFEMAKFLVKLDKRVEESQTVQSFRYSIYDNKETIFLLDEDIKYIKSAGNFSKYYLTKATLPNPILASGNLLKTFKTLNPAVFVRCHEQYIINIDFVEKLIRNNNSGGDIILAGNISIPFTKHFRSGLVEKGFLDK